MNEVSVFCNHSLLTPLLKNIFLNVYDNKFDFFNATSKIKIAVLHDDFYENLINREEFYSIFNKTCDFVFIYSHENTVHLLNYIYNHIELPNQEYILCGELNKIQASKKIHHSLSWISSTNWIYKSFASNNLSDLIPFSTKPFYFDYMPGLMKFHREQISRLIKINSLESKIFSTPFFNPDKSWNFTVDFSNKDYFGEGMVKHNKETYNNVVYHNHVLPASIIIPTHIYNKTAYSIVAETFCDSDTVFITEKTAKPLLSKRIFIAFASKNHMLVLKKCGFKTFDNIIDETYDTIDNNQKRIRMAFEQVKYLCSKPQEEILEKAKPILEHNFDLAINYDWLQVIAQIIHNKCSKIITKY